MSITDEGEYGQKQIDFLELIWGKGFLSPGGTTEVDLVIEGLDLSGLNILDIGCGCGGAVFHLIEQHGAATAIGVDIEPLVISRAKALADEYNLNDKASFEVVTPGPLPFSDMQFDMVFSKDAFLHIPDKESLMADIARVLKPDGIIAASDWMRLDDNPPSQVMADYIAAEGLDMHMCSLDRYSKALAAAGFSDIHRCDRNAWYLDLAQQEWKSMAAEPLRSQIIDCIGKAAADETSNIWRKMIGVLEIGEHRPGHFRAQKLR
ncbi:MAG: methyltransferase domain-containing protein [Alphaproteobacteria bacterium]|nr:methyltransferase domain-containing protein [Alphaproteobacteria bacterium]